MRIADAERLLTGTRGSCHSLLIFGVLGINLVGWLLIY